MASVNPSKVNTVAEQIEEHLQQISNYAVDIKKLTRPELGEEVNFSSGKESFQNIFNLLLPLIGRDISNAPRESLKKFEGELSSLLSDFSNIAKFSLAQSNSPVRSRDQMVASLKNRYYNLFESMQPILTFLLFYDNSTNRSTQEISNYIKASKELKESSESIYEEIKEILESSRKAVGSIGVSQFSEIFKGEYEHHKKIARHWLIATICVMAALISAGCGFLFFANHGAENAPYLIQLTVTKLLVLTVLFYALNLCSKNYKSHTHNSILNKHRQNALNTFETFVKASGDDGQTKNAVLLEATRTIFANQQTGYLSGENEVEFPSRIIEIIKSNKE